MRFKSGSTASIPLALLIAMMTGISAAGRAGGSTRPPIPLLPNALSVINAPLATGGQENTNYTTTGLGAAQSLTWMDLQQRISGIRAAACDDPQFVSPQILHEVRNALPPDQVITPEFQIRGTRGHFGPIYSPSLIYADNLRSFELALQHFDGSISGFGVAARIDFAQARRKFVKSLGVARTTAFDRPTREVLQQRIVDASTDYVSASRALRTALILGYQSISSVGTDFTGALSVSELIRLRAFPKQRDGEAAGLTPLLSVEGMQYDPSSPQSPGLSPLLTKSTSTFRARAALIFQDRTLFIGTIHTRNGDAKGPVGRWNYQIGLEYDFWNSFDRANTASAFLRMRPNEYVQFSLYAGLRSDKQDFVGLNLAFTIPLDGHFR